MPQINVARQRQRLRTRTGGNIASPGAARAAFAGQAAVGRGLQNIGQSAVAIGARTQAEQIQQQKEFDAKEEMKRQVQNTVGFVSARQRMNEVNADIEKQADEASPDGLSTLANYNDGAKELDIIAKEVDDPLLRARIESHSANLRLNSQARLSSVSDRKSTAAFNEEVQTSVSSKAKMIQDNPFSAPRMLAESREDIGGLSELYGKDKQKAINAAHNFYANNAMGAFLREGEKNEIFLNDGIAILKGKGPKEMVEVAKGLKPSERAAFLNKFQRAKERKKETGINELRTNMRDTIAFTLNGGTPTDKSVRGLRKQINSNTSLKLEEKVRAHDTLNSALVTGKAMKEAKTLPPSQWGAILDGAESALNAVNTETAELDPSLKDITKKEFNAATRIQHRKLLQAQMAQIQNQRLKDPSAFVQNNFEDIQALAIKANSGNPDDVNEYFTALKAKQDYLQIPERHQRFLGKEESFEIGNLVGSATDGDQLAKVMEGLGQKYGGSFPKVFEEVTKDNKLDPGLFISTHFQDFNTRSLVLGNISNKVKINEAVKNVPQFRQGDLDDVLNEKMDPIRRSLSAGDKTGFKTEVSNGFQNVVELEVKRRVAASGDVSNLGTVVDEVIDSVINKNYDQVEGGESLVLMPKGNPQKPNNKKLTESFMEVYSESENFATLEKDGEPIDYHIPTSLIDRFGKTNARKEYMEALEDNSRWVSNESMTGIILVYDDPSIGDNLPIVDVKGKNIEFTYEEISYNADPKTLENATSFFNTVRAASSDLGKSVQPSGGEPITPGGPLIVTGGTPVPGGG